jgi:anti-sigma28 factor (negative regulator of flagellin synthesis)
MSSSRRSKSRPTPSDTDLEPGYSAEYLRQVADGEARQERLAELKRRIELGAYHPDARSIAEGMLTRADEAGLRSADEHEDPDPDRDPDAD